ncbi:hypothetical protein OFN04_32245, partial [Escherichia coli]|nr:hypothetical protein [Escherichia coli]
IVQRQLLRRCQPQLTAALNSQSSPALASTTVPDARLQPLLADALHWLTQRTEHKSYIARCLYQFNADNSANITTPTPDSASPA